MVAAVAALPVGGAAPWPNTSPLSALQVPAGMVDAPLNVHGCRPATAMVEAARLEDVLNAPGLPA